MSVTVWFNEGFSSLYNVIMDIRDADAEGAFKVLCTHRNPGFLGLAATDISAVEPAGITGAAYVDYCLQTCRRYEVGVFMPTRGAAEAADRYEEFAAIGTRVVVCGQSETLRMINNKAMLYAHLAPGIVNIPEYRLCCSYEDFDSAVAHLKPRHGGLCLKPSVSIHGIGFKVLRDDMSEVDYILSGDGSKVGIAQMRRALKDSPGFKELLVMQYLEGAERSVDCLADNGSLIRLVIRLKSRDLGYIQWIEDNPEIEDTVRRLTRALGLNGIYNVQFKDGGNTSYLLEVNTRMSGGIIYSTLSGLNIPYWALRLFGGLCSASDIPHPRTGLKIAKIPAAVVIRRKKEGERLCPPLRPLPQGDQSP
ncbi:MAG: ATP-grasp domain-containing protein [Candidatus Magnetobacterium sp. LHC-1]